MIEGLKPYPSYRDSGEPWLGSTPTHWSIRRLKTMFHEVVSPSSHGTETLLSLRMERGLVDHHALGGKLIPPANLIGYKRVVPGQIVINRMRAAIGVFGLAQQPGIVSPDYAVMSCSDEIIADYYLRLFKTPQAGSVFRMASKGMGTGHSGFMRLYTDQFGRISAPYPSKDEQASIVRYLIHATREIDRAISSKIAAIRLLKEQRYLIVFRTITNGMDNSAAKKPSGIPWIGSIPAHWEVRKIKYLTRFENGLPFKPTDWKSDGTPIIRIQNLNGSDDFNRTDRKNLPSSLLIQSGDLLFAWSGNRGTSFGSFQWNKSFSGYLNQHIFKLTGYTLHRRYFYYLLRAVTRHVEEQAGGIIGLVHVTKPELGSVCIPIAPPAEAEAIAAHLDVAVDNLDQSIFGIESDIGLLREYRTRLIADIIMGKLDVRAAAASLPANAVEPAPVALDVDGDDQGADEDSDA